MAVEDGRSVGLPLGGKCSATSRSTLFDLGVGEFFFIAVLIFDVVKAGGWIIGSDGANVVLVDAIVGREGFGCFWFPVLVVEVGTEFLWELRLGLETLLVHYRLIRMTMSHYPTTTTPVSVQWRQTTTISKTTQQASTWYYWGLSTTVSPPRRGGRSLNRI